MKLSSRELEVLTLLLQGQTNKEIAINLKISANTVRDHIRRMMLRTGINKRAALVALYYTQKIAGMPKPVT